jgi:hypothetical protein
MQLPPFLALAICIVLFTVAQFVWQQRKSGEMPFRKYWFVYALVAWCAGVFLYGIIFFPDGPYHENTSKTPCVKAVTAKFCDKSGKPRTREEVEAYVVWQNTIILSWLVSVPTLWGAGWVAKRRKAVSRSAEP